MSFRLRLLGSLLVAFLFAGCAGPLKIGPDGLRVEATDVQIQKEIDKAAGFPVRKSLAGMAKVQIEQARLLLIVPDNSIGVSMPVKVDAMMKSWSGRIAFSATPVYEKGTGVIYVTNFALRAIEVPGLPAELGDLAAKAVTLVLQETVKRYDVYRLDGSKWGEGLAKLALKDIQVRDSAVAFHLGF